MSTITRPRSAVKAARRQPIAARLILQLNGTSYAVSTIAPGPDNSKAYRLEKLSGKNEVYDVCRTHFGLVECSCPSYLATHEGTISTCKHGQALVKVGLLDAPKVETPPAELPAPLPLQSLETAVARVRAITLIDDDGTPLETAADMDRRHRAEQAAAVAELMTDNPFLVPCCDPSEPSPCRACLEAESTVECPRCSGNGVREFFRPDGPELEECTSCGGTGQVDPDTAQTLVELIEAADLDADDPGWDGWDDDSRWTTTGTDDDGASGERDDFASWLDRQADHFRYVETSPFAEGLAVKLAAMAQLARWVDAPDWATFDDRVEELDRHHS